MNSVDIEGIQIFGHLWTEIKAMYPEQAKNPRLLAIKTLTEDKCPCCNKNWKAPTKKRKSRKGFGS